MTSRAPWLVTQLAIPPSPHGMVWRPRLSERLDRSREQPVTLVCGPAGSGKTTLVAGTVAGWSERVAWVSLEPTDNDPQRLWSVVLSALERAGVVEPGSALAELAAPVGRSEKVFVPLLVNALAELDQRVVLVLDDVHHVRMRAAVAQLSSLVVHMPDTVRLVLTARSDPPLPLHRLRLSGRLVEVRAAELAFTEEEATALFEAHGLDLAPHLVGTLRQRTEGWSAGLRLAALRLQNDDDAERFVEAFAGDERTVADYLMAEVLDRQPARVRSFLLCASLVDNLCGDLMDALTGGHDGANLLAELERSNAFVVRRHGHGEWYRLHALFGSLLRARASMELGERISGLRRKAARWYLERDMGADALQQAVLAEDWEVATAVVSERWFDFHVRGDAERVAGLLAQVPEPWRSEDAELAAALACAALEACDRPAARHHLAVADRAAPSLPESRRARHLQTMALARLASARLEGDYEAALSAADDLLNHVAGETTEVAAERQALVQAMLGETALWAHRFQRAEEELTRAIATATAADVDHVAVAAMADLGLVRVLIDGPTSDLQHAHAALALAERRGWTGISATGSAHVALALAALYRLRDDQCLEHLAAAEAAIAPARRRQLDLVISHTQARISGMRGQPLEGLRVLDEWDARQGNLPVSEWERTFVASLRARLLLLAGHVAAASAALPSARDGAWLVAEVADACVKLAAGAADEALDVLQAAARHEHRDVRSSTRIERMILEALAHTQLHDHTAARRVFEEALATAETTGHYRPFLEVGGGVKELLRDQVRAVTSQRETAKTVLDLLSGARAAPRPAHPLLEPLSDRERAILRYLPTNLSNREIAGELFITTNTVKSHLRNIYRKLDVEDRRQAVTRAQELRLIGSGARPGPR